MDIGQKLFYWICKQAESLIKDLLCRNVKIAFKKSKIDHQNGSQISSLYLS